MEPAEAVAYRLEERPGFVVFGFSWKEAGRPATADLVGILDYRRHSETQQGVELRSWQGHGARFELDGAHGTAFYVIRAPPGAAETGRLRADGRRAPGATVPVSALLRRACRQGCLPGCLPARAGAAGTDCRHNGTSFGADAPTGCPPAQAAGVRPVRNSPARLDPGIAEGAVKRNARRRLRARAAAVGGSMGAGGRRGRPSPLGRQSEFSRCPVPEAPASCVREPIMMHGRSASAVPTEYPIRRRSRGRGTPLAGVFTCGCDSSAMPKRDSPGGQTAPAPV